MRVRVRVELKHASLPMAQVRVPPPIPTDRNYSTRRPYRRVPPLVPLPRASLPPPRLHPIPSTTLLRLPRPPRQAREVLRQVLHALAHCHCQGITHRNLKPKYVLLRHPEGNENAWSVKLSDFNSVRASLMAEG